MAITDTIEAFLVEDDELAAGRDSVDHDEPLIEGGLIDSLGILKMIAFLEETFDVLFDESDIIAENFNTIQSIAELVTNRQEMSQSAQG